MVFSILKSNDPMSLSPWKIPWNLELQFVAHNKYEYIYIIVIDINFVIYYLLNVLLC